MFSDPDSGTGYAGFNSDHVAELVQKMGKHGIKSGENNQVSRKLDCEGTFVCSRKPSKCYRSSSFANNPCDKYVALSKKQSFYDEIPSRLRGHDESLPSRQFYHGDYIPSLVQLVVDGKKDYQSRRWHYGDERPLLGKPKYFDEIPSLSRKLSYADGIPSLNENLNNSYRSPTGLTKWNNSKDFHGPSRKGCNFDYIPSLSSRWNGHHSKFASTKTVRDWNHGDEIPCLSRKQFSEIPWLFRDQCNGGNFRKPSSGRKDFSYEPAKDASEFIRNIISNGGPLNNLESESYSTTASPNLFGGVAPSDYHKVDKVTPDGSSIWIDESSSEHILGPRAGGICKSSSSSSKKKTSSRFDQVKKNSKLNHSIQYEDAKFFVIKPFNEEDVHKSMKYNVWTSTPFGNRKLDAAFRKAGVIAARKGGECPVFLLFSVKTSGQFLGLAEMRGPVDFKKDLDFWQRKRKSFFPLVWHIIKDVPNQAFVDIYLESGDHRRVTYCGDAHEIGLAQGLEMLKIFQGYKSKTSMLDDFEFYEAIEQSRDRSGNFHTKNRNSESC